MRYAICAKRAFLYAVICVLLLLSAPISVLAGVTWWPTTTVIDSGDHIGQHTSVAIDTTAGEYPHISYYDATNTALKYAYYDGTWYTQAVDDTANVGQYTSLALGPAPNCYPHISYYDVTNKDLKYAYYNGGWNIETVDSADNVGAWSSLALESVADDPRISYYDATNDCLKYASGTWNIDHYDWTITAVDDPAEEDVGWYTSLALHSTTNNPRISYFDNTNGNLKYAYNDGAGWVKEIADSTGKVGLYTSLALDTSDNPRISYYDSTNKNLKYASRTGGSWSSETADSSEDVGHFTSLAIDSADKPYISYYDNANYNLKWAYKDGTWSKDAVDELGKVGQFTSLALKSDNPCISYYDETNKDLKYAQWDGSKWVHADGSTDGAEAADSGDDVGQHISLAFDSAGPKVSYYDVTNGNLKYAQWNESKDKYVHADNTTEGAETVDSVGDVGQYTSLALKSGKPCISYYDATNDTLKYTQWDGTQWTYADGTTAGFETVDDTVNVGQYSSLAIHPTTNNPHISYYDADGDNLKYTQWDSDDNRWEWANGDPGKETVDSADNVGQHTSLALNSSGYPHISYYYYDAEKRRLKYTKWNGEKWTTASGGEGFDVADEATTASGHNVGQYTSLALRSGRPHISYYDEPNALKYAYWDGGKWAQADGSPVAVHEAVDSTGSTGKYTSLALGAYGYPRISYYDVTNGNLRYAAWNGSDWDKETVKADDDVGQYTSLAIESDSPRICYYDATHGNLKYVAGTPTTTPTPPPSEESIGGCFIATAVYTDHRSPITDHHITILRRFRDEYLLTNTPGRAFVRFYHRHSPPIADFIKDKEPLKAIVKAGLRPIVWLIKKTTQ